MFQTRAVVAYAPQSTSTEELFALIAAAPVVLGWLEDSTAQRGARLRAPRSSTSGPLTGLSVVASSHGSPWDSSQSLNRFDSAPRVETVEVLLALTPQAPAIGAYGDWLDSPPVFSRYSIITPAQEDVAEMPPLAGPSLGAWFDMAEPARRGAPVVARRAFAAAYAAELPPIVPVPLGFWFDMAEPARRQPRAPRLLLMGDDIFANLMVSDSDPFVLCGSAETVFFSTPYGDTVGIR